MTNTPCPLDDIPRTQSQNKAMHLWFTAVAKECENQGLGMDLLLQEFEVRVTEETIKNIARSIGEREYGKGRTSDWTREECSKVINLMLEALAKKGLDVEFPNQDIKNFILTYDNQ